MSFARADPNKPALKEDNVPEFMQTLGFSTSLALNCCELASSLRSCKSTLIVSNYCFAISVSQEELRRMGTEVIIVMK